MRALAKSKAELGIWMEEVPMPTVGPNDILVEVRKTAICGTDIHIYNWDSWAQRTIPVSMTVGHEFSGTVAEVGSEVTGFAPGDRVSGESHVTCGHCRNCRAGRRHLCRDTVTVGVNRTGSFAEYLAIPALNAFRLSDAVSDEIGAILDPLGNATHAALSFDLVGEDVLITGAGPIGVMAAAIARHAGARHVVVTDVIAYRLELAKAMGASRAVDVAETGLDRVMDTLDMKEGFDVGLEMSGSAEALRGMLRTMNNGGRVAVLGIAPGEVSIEWDQLIFKSLTLKGIYGREMFETWYKMAAMLESGLDVGPVITHRLKADDYAEGFEVMRSGRSGKVVLDWT
jgi:threonine 3-dehydrogenase